MPSLFDMMSAPFVSRSTKTFHTDDDPRTARRVVDGMTVRDGAPGGLPPGVMAGKTGAGHFNAVSPVAGFDSQFETRSDGRGGSWVTERKTAFSPIPFMSTVATAIHDAATSPQDAYYRSRRRGG
jgi:hypothetical protein